MQQQQQKQKQQKQQYDRRVRTTEIFPAVEGEKRKSGNIWCEGSFISTIPAVSPFLATNKSIFCLPCHPLAKSLDFKRFELPKGSTISGILAKSLNRDKNANLSLGGGCGGGDGGGGCNSTSGVMVVLVYWWVFVLATGADSI
ncbi:hypothetical protein M0802_011918 [Mischocyttarus mexicanus]|nr:hypothetical protein M0802_011918 [Mischocyttarus mexicanus]